MPTKNVVSITAGKPPRASKPAARGRTSASAPMVSTYAARIAANEMSRLWQAHGIIDLVVHAIGDEVDNGGPSIKEPLQAAADVIWASIKALDPICTPGEV
jgi:hypothetical protein